MNEIMIKGYFYTYTYANTVEEAIEDCRESYPGIDFDYNNIECVILRDKHGNELDSYRE